MGRKKNILLISGHVFPEQNPRSFRTTELARQMAKFGNRVSLMVPVTDKATLEFAKRYDIELIELNYTWKVLGGNRNKLVYLFNRLLLHFFDYPRLHFYFLVRKNKSHLKNKDLIISIAQPFSIHWGVSSIWKKNIDESNSKPTWVADCGDPFANVKYDRFSKPLYFGWLENKFLERADFVSMPFEEMKDLFNSKYRSKYKVIPQGFDLKRDFSLPKYLKNRTPTFIYSGTIIPGSRDPFDLIDYLEQKEISYRFIIYTKQFSQLKKYEHLLGNKILVKNYIPREELIRKLALADFLINVNVREVEGLKIAIPTKLIDYRLSGRPILSYTQNSLPIEDLNSFLDGNYENAYVDNDFNRYDIVEVTLKFLSLLNAEI